VQSRKCEKKSIKGGGAGRREKNKEQQRDNRVLYNVGRKRVQKRETNGGTKLQKLGKKKERPTHPSSNGKGPGGKKKKTKGKRANESRGGGTWKENECDHSNGGPLQKND